MKLSLWNIYSLLPFKKMTADIKKDTACIRYARLSSGQTSQEDTVCVDVGNAFPGGHDVAVIHGSDTVFVDGETLPDVFNSVASILDRFAAWEQTLYLAEREENGVRTILDSAQDFLPGAYYALTFGGKTLGLSCPDTSPLRPIREEILATEDLSYERLYVLDQYIDFSGFLPGVRMTTEKAKKGDFYYTYQSIASEGVHIGFLVFLGTTPAPPKGAAVILNALTDHIADYYSFHTGKINLISHASEMLEKFLRADRPGDDIRQFFMKRGWQENDEYQILAIRCSEQGKSARIIRECRELFRDPLFCSYEKDLVVMLRSEGNARHESDLEHFLAEIRGGVSCGISSRFHYLYQAPLYLSQAREELRLSVLRGIDRREAEQSDSEYFSSLLLSDRLCRSYVHRSLLRLISYDTARKTAYYETLRAYVLSGFHHSDAAKFLHIHRNTLLYRLEQMRTIIDFSDFDRIYRENDLSGLYRYYISFFIIDEIRRQSR